jgi:hypothetical protein
VQAALIDAAQIDPRHFRELRTLFGEYALRDCALMRENLRFRDRATLTVKTVQLTELSISLRLDWVRHKAGAKTQWPPKPKGITGRADRAGARRPRPVAGDGPLARGRREADPDR